MSKQKFPPAEHCMHSGETEGDSSVETEPAGLLTFERRLIPQTQIFCGILGGRSKHWLPSDSLHMTLGWPLIQPGIHSLKEGFCNGVVCLTHLVIFIYFGDSSPSSAQRNLGSLPFAVNQPAYSVEIRCKDTVLLKQFPVLSKPTRARNLHGYTQWHSRCPGPC